MSEKSIKLIIGVIDRATAPIRKIESAVNRLTGATSNLNKVTAAAKQVSAGIGNVTKEATKLGARMAVIGGGVGWFLKSQLIDTASQFEQFRAVLETVEGSSAKAEKSLSWASDFAAKTPYELAEVTEAFVKLRAYGINPMDGTLRTLGDTASAMGKPLEMAVEAIADAVAGENERLKEFGISAETKGNRVRYTYTDREGKTRHQIVNNRRNREQVRETLLAIWNDRYAGAMEKMSKKYKGMMSNLVDQWNRFKLMVMQYGAFDFLKQKLEGILATVDRMAASGELKRLATEWGKRLTEGIQAAWRAAVGFWQVMQGVGRAISWLAGLMGGYKNLGIAIAVLMAGKLFLSVATLAIAFGRLGLQIKKTAAEYLAFQRLGGNFVGPQLPKGPGKIGGALGKVGKLGGQALAVGAAFGGGYEAGTLINKHLIDNTAIGNAIGEGLNRIAAALGNKESKLAIEINSRDGSTARVTKMQNRGMAVNVDSGLMMAGY